MVVCIVVILIKNMKVRELKEYLEPLGDEVELTNIYLLKTVKTCKNCGYRSGDQCLLSGYMWEVERNYPYRCGAKYENWTPRRPKLGLLTIVKNYLI